MINIIMLLIKGAVWYLLTCLAAMLMVIVGLGVAVLVSMGAVALYWRAVPPEIAAPMAPYILPVFVGVFLGAAIFHRERQD